MKLRERFKEAYINHEAFSELKRSLILFIDDRDNPEPKHPNAV